MQLYNIRVNNPNFNTKIILCGPDRKLSLHFKCCSYNKALTFQTPWSNSYGITTVWELIACSSAVVETVWKDHGVHSVQSTQSTTQCYNDSSLFLTASLTISRLSASSSLIRCRTACNKFAFWEQKSQRQGGGK